MGRPDPVDALTRLLDSEAGGSRLVLHSPRTLPQAGSFLWNRRMVLQVNCRGYVFARHLQPEPDAYAHAPFLEARTFMQPEQPHYAHAPGRFVLLRDEDEDERWSLPYEPLRRTPDLFRFEVQGATIGWRCQFGNLDACLSVRLPTEDVVELWRLELRNTGETTRRLSVYPCFTIGYMSWMNQSAAFDPALGALVARSVSPYQKLEDLDRILARKDLTFLLPDRAPHAWEASLHTFEGEGGWSGPSALDLPELGKGDALYETPVAALQYRVQLDPGQKESWHFLFGPAREESDIEALGRRWLSAQGFERAERLSREHQARGSGCLQMDTPDADFDVFANHWLNRQVFYHGDTNRLTTDPQTRNYLQDSLGLVYLDPATARSRLGFALARQRRDGSMPEGILLEPGSTLKYINEVPHADHCVWLPLCLAPYLDESGDEAFLDEAVTAADGGDTASVFDRVTRALLWLLERRDARGLSLIGQGDWCDPLNMAGPEGRGVSTWLSLACIHALRTWQPIASRRGEHGLAQTLGDEAKAMSDAVQRHCWDGDWFSRGITDDGRPFGVAAEAEGRIWLNPQSWALLAGVATPAQKARMLTALDEHLDSPEGLQLLSPPYTGLVRDIGRVTQKFPGSAENGSVYNHACAFAIHALYHAGESERAWEQLRRMIPGPDPEALLRRGQLPAFVPNYYRGAHQRHPRTAGRSSQLFHTGTASWLYRILVEDLFGLRGCPDGLRIRPALPAAWPSARVRRHFRGATFDIHYERSDTICTNELRLDGQPLKQPLITDVEANRRYTVTVTLPAQAAEMKGSQGMGSPGRRGQP